MRNFQAEIGDLEKAQRELDRYRADLEHYRELATDLRRSVPKSTSAIHDPVADKLNEVFAHRADRDGGVRGVLDDYLRELDSVQRTIALTLDAYSRAEQQAVARYGKEDR